MASSSDSEKDATVAAEESPAELVWHDFHRDPILDVVLRSSDNIYFRASSYHLKRESTMFNGMLSAMPNDHMRPEHAIPLDYPSTLVALFLDSYATRSRITDLSHETLDFDIVRQYHKLIHHLDCDRLRPVADLTYERSCDRWPFEWFQDASDANDIEMAKQALLRCGKGGTLYKKELTSKTVLSLTRQIRPEWRTSFFFCLTRDICSNNWISLEWPKAAGVKRFSEDVQLGTLGIFSEQSSHISLSTDEDRYHRN